MSRLRATLGEDGVAELPCPECGGSVRVVVDPELLRRDTPIRAKALCSCGWSHAVYLERRAAIRKDVELEGEIGKDGEWSPVSVHNLSRTGVRLALGEEGAVKTGERWTVRFTLHPGRPQEFERLLQVQWVDGDAAGAEFITDSGKPDYDPAYDLALALHER